MLLLIIVLSCYDYTTMLYLCQLTNYIYGDKRDTIYVGNFKKDLS